MTRNDFNRAFLGFGWSRYRDDAGDTVLIRRIGSLTVSCLIKIRLCCEVTANCSISIDAFDMANYFILNENCNIVENSIVLQKKIRKEKAEFSPDDLKDLSEEIVSWAISQDVSAGMAQLRGLPTNCLGAMPRRHMAALAVEGDVETLTHYRDSFAEGDRLDFVPYVDIDMIDRALDFARQRRDNPKWLPTTPRLRV